jgi:hypothetical protein
MKIQKIDKKRGIGFFLFFLGIFLFIISINFLLEERIPTRKEDVDGDGVDEIIKEIHFPDSSLVYVIEEDGTMYKTEYSADGALMHEWKLIPDPEKEGEYIIYVWDKRTEQWLFDQDRNGIPDEREN